MVTLSIKKNNHNKEAEYALLLQESDLFNLLQWFDERISLFLAWISF